MEITTDPEAKGAKVLIKCNAGHTTVNTVVSKETEAVLDDYCKHLENIVNGHVHGGCSWRVDKKPRCGAPVTVSWTDPTTMN